MIYRLYFEEEKYIHENFHDVHVLQDHNFQMIEGGFAEYEGNTYPTFMYIGIYSYDDFEKMAKLLEKDLLIMEHHRIVVKNSYMNNNYNYYIQGE